MSELMDGTFRAKIRRLDFNAFKDRVEDTITSKSPPFQPKPVALVTQEIYKNNFRLSEEKARAVADVAHYKSVITVFQNKIDEKDASIQSLSGNVTSLKDKCKALNSQLRDSQSREDAAIGLSQETQTRLTGVEDDLRKSNAEASDLKAHNELLSKQHAVEMDLVRAQRDDLQNKLDSTGNALQEEKAKVFEISQDLEGAKLETKAVENERAKVVTKLSAALDELTEVKARLAHETAEKTRLQAELKAALDIIAQQNTLIQQKDDALLRMQDEMEDAKEKSASVLEELREKFEVAEDQIAGMKSKMATLFADLAASTSLVDSMTVELQLRSEEVDQHKTQIEVLRADAVAKEKELGDARDELKGVEGRLDEAYADCANLNALLAEKDTKIDVTMIRCKSFEEEFAAYREKAEKDAQHAKDTIESLNQQIRVAQEEKENTVTQLSSVRLELDDTKAQLVDANERNISLSDSLMEQQDNLLKAQAFLDTASNDLRVEKLSHRASITVAEVEKDELLQKVSERDETIARLSKDQEVVEQKFAQLVKAKEIVEEEYSNTAADFERIRTDFATLQEKLKNYENVHSTPARTTLPTPAPTPTPTPPPVISSLPSTPTKSESENPPTPVSNTRRRAPQIQSQFIRTLVLNQAKSNSNNQSGVVPRESADTPPATPASTADSLPSGESSSSVQPEESPVPSTPTPEAKTGRRRRRNRHFNRKKKNAQAAGTGSSLD
ncbi:hypothetical protein NLI96_g12154 [Meripilus lineatus]|uniref:Uncharacterized protein n=1 Tax=Meripilus lineatus TaxID=2056292 RepID=A0AAD5Y8G7_9APHY|nr:hypothetical protein NLI96_g12154 [Physisporinus lineatus]